MIYVGLERSERIKQEGAPINGFIIIEAFESIVNAGAKLDTKSRYNICSLSGTKQKPHKLVIDPYTGALVRSESQSNFQFQTQVKIQAEQLKGAERPESKPVFITDRVLPEDL